MQDNDIINLLGIKDSTIKILSGVIKGTEKTVEFEKRIELHYCPLCGCRMHSKGVYRRRVNHPILQDGYTLVMVFHQRRWQCSNKSCREIVTDEVSFIDKRKRNTNITDWLIVKAFKDFSLTAAQIARRFNVSDTYALHTFDRYVDMKRRDLTEVICVDEVHLEIPRVCNYALVIQDFISGEPLDLVVSRRKEITEPYFAHIPAGERARVKYIVSDMYGPFIDYSKTYFPKALSAVDSFHVIKMINQKIKKYILQLIRKLNDIDVTRQQKLEQELGHHVDLVHSLEYKIIKHYQWLILSNNRKIDYGHMRYDRRFGRYIYPSDIEAEMFKIDPNLKDIRDLKEVYIKFNDDYVGDPEGARKGLKDVIKKYQNCKYRMFNEVADSLSSHFEEIITSFILVKKCGAEGFILRRLSNGPMESLNRVPKDMKRNARGYRNFDHIRNRFLFAKRKNAEMLGHPKPWREVCFNTGLKRGTYKKTVKSPKLKK